MKLVFLLPVMHEFDAREQYNIIETTCKEIKIDFDIIYVLNGNMQKMFADIRNTFLENDNVRAIKMMSDVNEHKLITIGMKYCEDYSATIIYTCKEDINANVIKAFVTSWKSGNNIVYLKKARTGIKKFFQNIGLFFYNLGIKILKIYRDFNSEDDIQLLDQEAVRTINQLPEKNRQLRILDSFVGFNSEVVSVVDNKKNRNSEVENKYKTISKKYTYSLTFSILTAIIFLCCLIFQIVAVAVSLDLGLIGEILLISIIFGSAFLGLLFATKTALNYRIGDYIQVQEINLLDEKAEKYNLKIK